MSKHTRQNANPRKIPRSLADVKRAEREGRTHGIKQAVKMVLYILLDKHGTPPEDVRQISDELRWLSGAIIDGGLSWNFVDEVLKEYEIDLEWI